MLYLISKNETLSLTFDVGTSELNRDDNKTNNTDEFKTMEEFANENGFFIEMH